MVLVPFGLAPSQSLLLFDGPSNEVLAVLIWYMWDEGNVEAIAAIGVMLMTVLFFLTLGRALA